MKKLSLMLSALSLSAALGFAAPAFAEDMMLGGMVVPADQVAAVQAKCDTFTATESLADSEDAATTENKAGSDAGSTGSDLDMDKITMQMCLEGGFATSATVEPRMMGGMAVPVEMMEAVQTKCDTLKAETPTETLADSTDAATTSNTSGSDTGTTGSDLDIANITMAMCIEGGFAATM
jgi:hypothetical protein